jgi:hypothetical protein
MSNRYYNRIKCAVSGTPGTGTITLGSASSGYQLLPSGADGEVVNYVAEDGTAWEIGTGAYTHSGTTLSRGLVESSTGSLINLTSDATVFVSINADSNGFLDSERRAHLRAMTLGV